MNVTKLLNQTLKPKLPFSNLHAKSSQLFYFIYFLLQKILARVNYKKLKICNIQIYRKFHIFNISFNSSVKHELYTNLQAKKKH